MPYPIDTPAKKHDLVCPRMIPPPETGTLIKSEWGFDSAIKMLRAVEKGSPPELKKVSSIYSYPDSPKPPMSRALCIIGFVDTSSVQALVGGSEIPDCLHRCTVAVRRADGSHASQLDPSHSENSSRFAKFVKRLHKEGVVGVVGSDKEKRFGFFVPMPDTDGYSSNYNEDDFAAICYIGEFGKVKQYLESQPAPQTPPVEEEGPTWQPSTPPPENDDGPTWQPSTPPPEGDDGPSWQPSTPPPDGEGGWQPSTPPPEGGEGDDGLWKPPGSEGNNESNNGDSGGFWQPPGGDDSGGFGGGDGGDWDTENNDNDGGRKRSHSEAEEPTNGDTFHADSGAAAADKFYSGLTRSLDTRADSRLFHMRAFNGWVKATQIQELDPKTGSRGSREGMRVLDLACGKGGDLGKWVHHKRGMSNYVGVDVARGSLRDAAIRARKMRKKLPRCTFTCADLGADVPGRLRSSKHSKMQKLLSWSLHAESEYESDEPEFRQIRGGGISLDDKFDVISIQFAIHYMFSSRKRARRFFQTCSELLEVGGNLVATTIDARVVLDKLMDLGLNYHFDDPNDGFEEALVTAGNRACQIRFTKEIVERVFKVHEQKDKFDSDDFFGLEYSFTLVEGSDHAAGVGDAVNLPEWLNPIPVLSALAEEAGLKLVSAENFHEFFDNRKNPSAHPAAHEALYNMKVLNRNGAISKVEWEISRLYVAVKFQKVRESKMVLEEDDFPEENDEDEEPPAKKPALDPAKSKMFPMAMMKAKRAAGANWTNLNGDQKKVLIQVELEKLGG